MPWRHCRHFRKQKCDARYPWLRRANQWRAPPGSGRRFGWPEPGRPDTEKQTPPLALFLSNYYSRIVSVFRRAGGTIRGARFSMRIGWQRQLTGPIYYLRFAVSRTQEGATLGALTQVTTPSV